MSRVALVTGGTRGIGASVCTALKAEGYSVAANYGGNDEAAKAFSETTGIPVFRWDVGDYDACAQGIAKVEAEIGSIDVLVNNAATQNSTPFLEMEEDNWDKVIAATDNISPLANIQNPGMPYEYYRGVAFAAKGDAKNALDSFKKAEQTNPNNLFNILISTVF